MLEPGGPSPGHLGGRSEFPRLDSVCGQGAHSTGEPCLLPVPQFVWGHLGLHSTTLMGSMPLIAENLLQERLTRSCLLPLRVGRISKSTWDCSLGRRFGMLMGKGRSQREASSSALVKVTAPSAPSSCHPGSSNPFSSGTPQQGKGQWVDPMISQI